MRLADSPAPYVASATSKRPEGMLSQLRDDYEGPRKLDDPLKSSDRSVQWLTGPKILENMATNEQVRSSNFRGPMMDWTDEVGFLLWAGDLCVLTYRRSLYVALP